MDEKAINLIIMILQHLWANEDAGTAVVEYAVLISVTVSLLAAGLYFYGNTLQSLYQNLGEKVKFF